MGTLLRLNESYLWAKIVEDTRGRPDVARNILFRALTSAEKEVETNTVDIEESMRSMLGEWKGIDLSRLKLPESGWWLSDEGYGIYHTAPVGFSLNDGSLPPLSPQDPAVWDNLIDADYLVAELRNHGQIRVKFEVNKPTSLGGTLMFIVWVVGWL